MIRSILKKIGIYQKITKRRLEKRINAERAREEWLVTSNYTSDKTVPLTAEEKRQIDSLWGQLLPINSYKEFEMFKKIYGFDARFLTHNIYLPIVARLLNDFKYTTMFDDKGLLGYIADSCIKFPYCFVRHIGQDYYNNEMQQISLKDAINNCAQQEELFIKPSHNTSGGKGAILLKMNDKSIEEKKLIIQNELNKRNNDFVIQECIHQHPIMSQFNPSSINTLRITTLMLNGTFSVGSILLRCGKPGSAIDNWGTGGVLVTVNTDGRLNKIGHDIHLNEYSQYGDCIFAECSIPQIPDILRQIERAHRENFSICKFIGWDIAIDENENPIILELNSSQPGVIGEQIVAGPIFGDRTQEVIDYCKHKQFSY